MMIKYEEALKIVLDSAIAIDKEVVSLQDSLGRVLYDDIASDVDMPPFNKSAMDGYACKIEDLDKPLDIIETIPAGVMPKKTIAAGECSKIMTGGVVPDGADCVVMVEHAKTNDNRMYVIKQNPDKNICYKAEDVRCGDKVLDRGTLVTPSEIAILASVGLDRVFVSKKPVISIVATGSELVEPGDPLDPAKIRNSNSYQLFSQAIQAGFKPLYVGIAEDTKDKISKSISNSIDKSDIIILSGGVSMGDFDHVPAVLRELGFELYFQKVAIKPGKPVVFGKKDNTYVFGLPGNPVSTFMIFELFVKPFCFKLMQSVYRPIRVQATISESIKRFKSGRIAHIPVSLDSSGICNKISFHGSAHIHALTKANGYITLAIGVKEIREGENVTVTLIK